MPKRSRPLGLQSLQRAAKLTQRPPENCLSRHRPDGRAAQGRGLLGSRKESATFENSSSEAGITGGVRLRVSVSNCLVFSLSTTVRAILAFCREATQTFSASLRSNGSVSASGISVSNVSSAEMDLLDRFGTTGLWSMPRASSYRRWPYLPKWCSKAEISIA